MKDLIKKVNEILENLDIMKWVLEGNPITPDEKLSEGISCYEGDIEELQEVFKELTEKYGETLIKDLAE